MKARIIETFCEGKFQDARNEDRLLVNARHIAVIDGSSAAQPVGGRAGGIVAAEALLDVLDGLAADATVDTFAATACSALASVAREHGVASPYAAAVVLSLDRAEIWRIGDCPFAVDGAWNIPPHMPHEQAFFAFRRMMASGYARLQPHDDATSDFEAHIADIKRDWLAMTKLWVNAGEDEPFAFPALDERPAPASFKEVYALPRDTRSLILASDGAVVSTSGQRGPADVATMRAAIAAVRALDPLCLTHFPYWRGFLDRSSYLDDTTFVSVALEP